MIKIKRTLFQIPDNSKKYKSINVFRTEFRHDITEILLKVTLNTFNLNRIKFIILYNIKTNIFRTEEY